jgi:hypothetical protein
MSSTPAEVHAEIRRHGATVVSDAAYRWMAGDPDALSALGLAVSDREGAYAITVIAYVRMSPEERAADVAAATIASAQRHSRAGR